jgi:hypothetical protein
VARYFCIFKSLKKVEKRETETPDSARSAPKSPPFRVLPAIDCANKPKHLRERSFRGEDGPLTMPGGFAEFAASYYQHQRSHAQFMHAHAGAHSFYGAHADMQGYHYGGF